MKKNKTLRSWLFALRVLERGLRIDQARSRNRMITTVANQYEHLGILSNLAIKAHKDRTEQNIADHYRRTIPVFSKLALRQIKSRRIERKQQQTIYERLIADWISTQALRKATMIADTDRTDILSAISKGLDEGEGIATVAARIRKVSDLTPYRASLIARTETHAAATYGSVESVREAERTLGVVMLKEWLPTLDDRTRHWHAQMSDHPAIPMDEKFSVPRQDGGTDYMDRPGDPSASIGNLANCRCAISYSEAE